jgi:hypothetical protein
MYVADLERALQILGPRLYQLYGQGESPMTIAGFSQRLRRDMALLGFVVSQIRLQPELGTSAANRVRTGAAFRCAAAPRWRRRVDALHEDTPRKLGSHRTPRWREGDSNPRSPGH